MPPHRERIAIAGRLPAGPTARGDALFEWCDALP
jgi:hypothetical protein